MREPRRQSTEHHAGTTISSSSAFRCSSKSTAPKSLTRFPDVTSHTEQHPAESFARTCLLFSRKSHLTSAGSPLRTAAGDLTSGSGCRSASSPAPPVHMLCLRKWWSTVWSDGRPCPCAARSFARCDSTSQCWSAEEVVDIHSDSSGERSSFRTGSSVWHTIVEWRVSRSVQNTALSRPPENTWLKLGSASTVHTESVWIENDCTHR
mmetsp:Transcript_31151/g.73969  ORF Transcript_31151/g.73969 Transcript_31151/m.73969 type:complete len:207 (+) Transcript_31151:229-849(+)